jgi:hypothetical protein
MTCVQGSNLLGPLAVPMTSALFWNLRVEPS